MQTSKLARSQFAMKLRPCLSFCQSCEATLTIHGIEACKLRIGLGCFFDCFGAKIRRCKQRLVTRNLIVESEFAYPRFAFAIEVSNLTSRRGDHRLRSVVSPPLPHRPGLVAWRFVHQRHSPRPASRTLQPFPCSWDNGIAAPLVQTSVVKSNSVR